MYQPQWPRRSSRGRNGSTSASLVRNSPLKDATGPPSDVASPRRGDRIGSVVPRASPTATRRAVGDEESAPPRPQGAALQFFNEPVSATNGPRGTRRRSDGGPGHSPGTWALGHTQRPVDQKSLSPSVPHGFSSVTPRRRKHQRGRKVGWRSTWRAFDDGVQAPRSSQS